MTGPAAAGRWCSARACCGCSCSLPSARHAQHTLARCAAPDSCRALRFPSIFHPRPSCWSTMCASATPSASRSWCACSPTCSSPCRPSAAARRCAGAGLGAAWTQLLLGLMMQHVCASLGGAFHCQAPARCRLLRPACDHALPCPSSIPPAPPRPPPPGQAGVERRPLADGGAGGQGVPRGLRQGRRHPQPGGRAGWLLLGWAQLRCGGCVVACVLPPGRRSLHAMRHVCTPAASAARRFMADELWCACVVPPPAGRQGVPCGHLDEGRPGGVDRWVGRGGCCCSQRWVKPSLPLRAAVHNPATSVPFFPTTQAAACWA